MDYINITEAKTGGWVGGEIKDEWVDKSTLSLFA